MTEDVDPENPRPEGRYHVEAESTWYYVNDDLADTIATGSATDAEPGDDWILSFTAAGTTADDRERVCVRLTPRALQELYIETKDLSADSRRAGHSGELPAATTVRTFGPSPHRQRIEPIILFHSHPGQLLLI